MKNLLKILSLCVLVFAFAIVANAQDKKKSGPAVKTLKVTKKVVVVVVGTTAKAGYKTTKFAAKRVAKPIIVKSAPKVTKFALTLHPPK